LATKNDLYNYSGYSYEELVDLVLKLQDDNKALDDSLGEVNEVVNDLTGQVHWLTEQLYP
jgi:hypothetical protein